MLERRKKGEQQGRKEGAKIDKLVSTTKQAQDIQPPSLRSIITRVSFRLSDRFHPPVNAASVLGPSPARLGGSLLRRRIESVVSAAQTMQISPTYSGMKFGRFPNGLQSGGCLLTR